MPTLSNMGHPNTLLASSPSHLPFSRACAQYTADNLSEKGIHEVQARRFVLVAAEYACNTQTPLVTRPLYSPPPPPRPQPPDRVRDLGERRQASGIVHCNSYALSATPLTPRPLWQTDGRDLGALSRLAPRRPVTPPPPRLTRPPPRPQMMPEGLVLVAMPQTQPFESSQTPFFRDFAGRSRSRSTTRSCRLSRSVLLHVCIPRARHQLESV